MTGPRVLGLIGWSGSGKTTLLVKLIPLLVGRGLRVSTVKHAHHTFDVDIPGKDSYEHRKAGAGEVILASSRRWVLMHEAGDGPEPALADLLRRLSVQPLENGVQGRGVRQDQVRDGRDVVQVGHRNTRRRQGRVAGHRHYARVAGMQDRLARRGAEHLDPRMRLGLEALDQDQVAG